MTQKIFEIQIPLIDVTLKGFLSLPPSSKGLVIFVHGSGSSRKSPRNQFVAQKLQEKNLATLLFDLLTEKEEEFDRTTGELRFNIPFLSQRLLSVTSWIEKEEETKDLCIGYFGASTGAAAALSAAAEKKEKIFAVVSRGGRPDLAKEKLTKIISPTLLIVGGEDTSVIELNKLAQKQMSCETLLKIIPNATHLFEEKGTLEEVCYIAGKWFKEKLEETLP